MRVKGWYIDGFGIFRDFEVRDLGPGLTVFAGPNEAGKSTLLAFLRGMLFGFADGRSRDARYVPLRGGRHGGRLLVSASDGDYIIERQVGGRPPVRVTSTNGHGATDAALARMLGGADDRLFKSVFAFSLTELQSFDSLSTEGVRDRIFSAGIAGAGRSARDAVRDLEARTGALLKPRGAGAINGLLADLRDVQARIETARAAATAYTDVLGEEEERKQDIERLGREADGLRSRIARAAVLADLWPVWCELQAARAELEGLEAIDEFPPGAEARLAAILHQTRTADEMLEELQAGQRAAEQRRADLRVDDALAAVAAEVESLHEMVALQRNLLQQLPAARVKLFQTRELLDEKLRSLGPDWDEERVEQFDQSIARQEEVRAWQDRLQRSAADVERARRELDAALRTREEARQARDRAAAALAADAPDGRTIEEQIKTLRRLRANLAELRAEETAAAAQDAIAKDRERALRLLETSARPPLPPGATRAPALTGLAAMGVAVWRATAGDLPFAIGAGAAGILLVVLGAILAGVRRRQAAQQEERDRNRAMLSGELDEAVSARVRHRHRAAVLGEHIAEDAHALDLPARPSFQEVEDRDADLTRQRTERLQWSDAHARLQERDLKVTDAIHEGDRVAASLEEAQRSAADLQAEWDAWKRAAQLPDSLSPQGVLDYFEAIRVCRECSHARRAAKSEGVQLTEQIGHWEDRAGAALNGVGVRDIFAEEQLIDQLVDLRRRCVEDQQARAAVAALDDEIRQRAAKIAAAESAVRRCRAERARLLDEAGAADEADFAIRLETYQRRTALKVRVQGLENQIVARIGRGEEADALQADLASGRIEEWRQTIASSETRAIELQQLRDDAIARHRDAERTRLDLESSADVARLELEREGLIAELAAAARQWQVARLAGALIEETLREFERTRQPEVLAEASRTFSFITQGRYERLVQEEDAPDVIVMDAKGGRRPVDGLSRGTAEQLYLCIRLALASEFARRSEPLPLVMDDVFVNFDPDRAEAVAQVVAQFATGHQVLVFTCHPSTRDLLLRVDPAAALVELQQVDPVAPPLPRVSRLRSIEPPAAPEAATRQTAAEPEQEPEIADASAREDEASLLALLDQPPAVTEKT